MGQRLVLTIKKKGRPMASAYYHWSGYTDSAFGIVEDAYNALMCSPTTDPKLRAIYSLENTGARFPKYDNENNDVDKLTKLSKYNMEKFETDNDRNRGLISCFPKSMEQQHDWGENFAEIDMDTGLIYFDSYCYYDNWSEVCEYYDDAEDSDFPMFEASLDECDIGTLRDIVNAMNHNDFVQVGDHYVSLFG